LDGFGLALRDARAAVTRIAGRLYPGDVEIGISPAIITTTSQKISKIKYIDKLLNVPKIKGISIYTHA
jgi:hypothetical protein